MKHEGEQHSKKKVMDKTTIDIDAKNNIIRIYKKGTSEPLYEVSDAEDIKTFINNGKEYKKDKEYRKEFGKKTLKKVDPAILGILVDIGNMELAEEYVNAFKNRNSNDIDIKYLFSNYTVGIPQKIVRNYIDSAKEAKKVKAVTVEGLSKGFMSMFKKWSNANQATMLESARMKEARMAKEDADANQPKGEKAKDKKAKKQSRFERFARRVLGDKGYEDTVKAAEEGKPKNEEKNSFKDEMSKDAPSPEKQAKTAQDFETQKGKREKRERKDRTTVEEVK